MNELLVYDATHKQDVKTKKCTQCKEQLPLDRFGRDSGANYLRGKCRSCEKQNAKGTTELRKQYAPPNNPDYACPICLSTAQNLIDKGYKPKWCLDHDHESGEFRGYICNLCNTGISNLKENIEVLRRATIYLEQYAIDHYNSTARQKNSIGL